MDDKQALQQIRRVLLDLLSEYRELDFPANPELLRLHIENSEDKIMQLIDAYTEQRVREAQADILIWATGGIREFTEEGKDAIADKIIELTGGKVQLKASTNRNKDHGDVTVDYSAAIDNIVEQWIAEGRSEDQIHGVKNFISSGKLQRLLTTARSDWAKEVEGKLQKREPEISTSSFNIGYNQAIKDIKKILEAE